MLTHRLSAAALILAAPFLTAPFLAGCAAPDKFAGSAPPCDTSFRVVNASSGTVEKLHFSQASQTGWGLDQLGQAVLPPGQAIGYRAASPGDYDFRVVWANGRAAERRRIDICAASTITVHDSGLSAN
ncbi:MAG: hypothetical protein JWP04_3028 [Belnapia sp.]|nr:hypothetical protein [Belnapia sp.]